jgi:hypothetical protein
MHDLSISFHEKVLARISRVMIGAENGERGTTVKAHIGRANEKT